MAPTPVFLLGESQGRGSLVGCRVAQSQTRLKRLSSSSSSSKSFPQFIMIPTVKGFGVADETEVDAYLEFPSSLYDPMNIGSLISGSSAFFKPYLDSWKFLVHIMLKPSMQNFKHDLTSMGDECNCLMLGHSGVLLLLGTGMRIDLFQCCGHCWVFQIC